MIPLIFKKTNSKKNTRANIFFNEEITKIINVEIYLISNGYGLEHELVELNILNTVLKQCPEIINFDYKYCKSLFHYYTNVSLEMNNHIK